MRKFLLICFLAIAASASSQKSFDIKGLVADTAGQPLPNATVKLYYGKDSSITSTDKTGYYFFGGVTVDSFNIMVSYSGLQSVFQPYLRTSTKPVFNIPPISMVSNNGMMEGIVIRTTIPMVVKEDTVQFNASAYKVREGAPVEDVLKKLPGVSVDKDGVVTAQGKEVKRVRVNGKD